MAPASSGIAKPATALRPDVGQGIRSPGLRKLLAAVAVAWAAHAATAEPSPFDALRARFPRGVPWNVEIFDGNGTRSGALEMRITAERASSCLGDMADGVRVEFTRRDALPPTLSVAAYGVASIAGDRIKIDLTGGICDAYLLMSGTIAADGSSAGDVYTFGMRGGKGVATYRATVR